MLNDLVISFSKEDAIKIEKHLRKLIPYLASKKFSIAGGIAIRYHIQNAGIPYPKRPFNDLDIIVEDISVVSPDIKKEFLTYHIHTQKDKFLLAFVDEKTRTKVDIFMQKIIPENLVEVILDNKKIYIKSIEDQLVKTVCDIQRISKNDKVDPKQFSDSLLLQQIADIEKANRLWKKIKKKKHPDSIEDAIKRAFDIKKNHQEWVKKSPFRKPSPYKCPDCIDNPNFPITPMSRIYKILGYVE